MAAKLIRKTGQLVVVGAPTSAADAAPGAERAPAIFRQLGLVDRLSSAGYRVTDTGDLPVQIFQLDPENPRARNLPAVLAAIEAVRARVEQAARSHALPLVLGGDASISVGLVAGLRRQAPSLGLIHVSRYADLHTPAHTADGLIGPMTVSHLIGQGAAELVRFWKSPPLVREPDLVVFGLEEPDEIDTARLKTVAIREYPLPRVRKLGAQVAAKAAVEHFRGEGRDFAVHLSWDIFPPQEVPGCERGLPFGVVAEEVGEALQTFAASDRFAGFSISGYNPHLDPRRTGALIVVNLVAEAFSARLSAPPEGEEEEEKEEKEKPAAAAAAALSAAPTAAPPDPDPEIVPGPASAADGEDS